ncbi:MAG: helix-turn-helix domain-containing protein [Acidimicrobiales bacterium]
MQAGGNAEVEYLTPGQVARLLHVSPKTVNRWADQGRIGCIVTLGGHRRFALPDVTAVIEQMASRSPRRAAEPDPG